MLKHFLWIIFLFFSFTINAAQVQVLSPKKISPTLSSSNQKTFTYQASSNNLESYLLLTVGSGEDLSLLQCSPQNLFTYFSCATKNLSRSIEVMLTRPTSTEVSINGQLLVSPSNFNPAKGKIIVQTIANLNNSLAISKAVLGMKSGYERRKREHEAILRTMESFNLITISRGCQTCA